MIEIDPKGLKAMLDRGERVHLLDVREPMEIAICRIEGSENIPMMQLFVGAKEPSAGLDDELVVLCHHGIRSFEAAQYLRMKGFRRARSLSGGIDAWAAEVDPTLARY